MYTINKLLYYVLLWSKCTFNNNDTCRFIVVICFVYMGDNTIYLFSFVFNKTEKEMYIHIFLCHFILQKKVYYYCISPEYKLTNQI